VEWADELVANRGEEGQRLLRHSQAPAGPAAPATSTAPAELQAALLRTRSRPLVGAPHPILLHDSMASSSENTQALL
jgi:hypothetical protein